MKYFIYIVVGIVVIVVIAGFFVVGSPKEERMRRFDGERVAHLQQLQWNIIEYWQSKGKLPTKLADLNDPTRGVIVPVDPDPDKKGEPYGYEIKGPEEFHLCATFSTATSDDGSRGAKPIPAEPFGGIRDADAWAHGPGRVCFDRKIDKDFLKPRPPVKD